MKPTFQEVGRAVVSTQGRDKGRAYLVVSVIDDRHVLLADGDARKLTHPKMKQVKHLRVAPLMAADALSATLNDARPATRQLAETTLPAAEATLRELRATSRALRSVTERIDEQGAAALMGAPRLPDYKP